LLTNTAGDFNIHFSYAGIIPIRYIRVFLSSSPKRFVLGDEHP
jgi:hypothetical protein